MGLAEGEIALVLAGASFLLFTIDITILKVYHEKRLVYTSTPHGKIIIVRISYIARFDS
jgi:hypothetical protein